jgi:hypothetical protein
MRTTVRLDDDLLAAAKQRAAAEQTTLTALIEDSLKRTLAARPPRRAERFTIRRAGDGRLKPGIDLDDSAGLRDLMDGLR